MGVALGPVVEVESVVGWFDDGDGVVVFGEEVGEALAPGAAGGVGVGDGDDGAGVGVGAGRDSGGDGRVGVLGAEDTDCEVAGLGGGERVGDAFADDQHVGVLFGGGLCPGEAGVAAEGGGGVVVFVAVDGLEVAGLDVADGAVLIERREGRGDALTAWEAVRALEGDASGVGPDVVGAQDVGLESRVGR